MGKVFSALVAVLVGAHFVFNLERLAYVNEFFSLLGIVLFVKYFFVFFSSKVTRLQLSFLFFFIYISLRFVASAVSGYDGNWYQILRTFVLYYSIFQFFLGYWLFHVLEINGGVGKTSLSSWLAPMSVFWGGKISSVAAFLYGFSSYKKYRYFVVFSLVFTFFFKNLVYNHDGNSTFVLIIALVFLFLYFERLTRFVLFSVSNPFYLLILSYFSLYILYSSYYIFEEFYEVGFIVFGEGDNNLYWRLMFWALEVERVVRENLFFGIGFGVPLFDMFESTSSFIVNVNPQDENLAYTIGLHNSFLFLFVRSGLVGFTLFLIFFGLLMRKSIRLSQVDSNIERFFLAFATLVIAALFNVVLESSLYAGIFWISAGWLYASISWRQSSCFRCAGAIC